MLGLSRHTTTVKNDASWELGGHPELAGLRLRVWVHMLGFRGHWSTGVVRGWCVPRYLRSSRWQPFLVSTSDVARVAF